METGRVRLVFVGVKRMTASTVKVMVEMRSVGVDDRMVMDEHLLGGTGRTAKGRSKLKYTELR